MLATAADPSGRDTPVEDLAPASDREASARQLSAEATPDGKAADPAEQHRSGAVRETGSSGIAVTGATGSKASQTALPGSLAESSVAATSSNAPAAGPREPPRHYWGQAVQYLDRSVAVAPGKKLMLMAKRDGPRVRFHLRVRLKTPASPAAQPHPYPTMGTNLSLRPLVEHAGLRRRVWGSTWRSRHGWSSGAAARRSKTRTSSASTTASSWCGIRGEVQHGPSHESASC